MAKPPPYPPKSSGRTMAGPSKKKPKYPSFAGSDTEPYNVRPQKPKATPMGKMMGKAIGKKVDPMDFMRPKPKKRVGDLREMGPRKPPAKTMPKQMGPKKAMKPKQMKRMGY